MTAECNLCGGRDIYALYRKRGENTGIVHTVAKCRRCGLVFVSDMLPQETIQGFYAKDYYNSYKKDYNLILESVRSIKEYRPGQTLLDVGCGMGQFLKEAQDNGYGVTGTEFSREAYEHLKGKFDVYYGKFEEINLNQKYDIIVALGVLKHIQDPTLFFEKVKLHLKDDGIFFCITANFNSLISRILGPRWSFIEPDKHLYYFSAATLEKYFQKAGLKARYLHPYCNRGKRPTRFFLRSGIIRHKQPSNPIEHCVYALLGAADKMRNIAMPYAINVRS